MNWNFVAYMLLNYIPHLRNKENKLKEPVLFHHNKVVSVYKWLKHGRGEHYLSNAMCVGQFSLVRQLNYPSDLDIKSSA
jgi:hypothetical protein